MVTLKLSNEQVVDLIKQLPATDKRAVLEALGSDSILWWEIRLAQGEEQLRQFSSQHSLDWDKMTEEEREQFIDNLLHEEP
jgi:hypothetical protein